MSCKRSIEGQDPDYQDDLENDNKRLRVIEKDSVAATVKKIEKIIEEQFAQEMKLKEEEIETIDEKLYEARQMLDQLRAGIIISYYSNIDDNSGESSFTVKSESKLPIHPAVKKLLGKFSSPKLSSVLPGKLSNVQPSSTISRPPNVAKKAPETVSSACQETKVVENNKECEESVRAGRFKVKKRIIVGNVSKYIFLDQREGQDVSHKWMVYVRGPKEEPSIHGFVSKVVFWLHPSYRPNDRVEITQPPFHLTRRGWGEFKVRVLIHFHDSRNKVVDVEHMLKLDQTATGLQTLGAETIVDVLIFKEDVNSGVDKKPTITQTLYPIPSDTGGISIPAEQEEASSGTSAKSSAAENTPVLGIKIKQEKIDPAYEDDRKEESCAVSSFINDHGNYFNQNVKVNEVHKDSEINKTNRVISIKQEPPDNNYSNNHVKANSVSILNLPNSKLLFSEKVNSIPGGKVIPGAVTNKMNSININSKFNLAANPTLLTLPRNNTSSILMVPQKIVSPSTALKSKDKDVINKLKLPCSSNSAPSPTTMVKYEDKQGNVYLITLPNNSNKTQENSSSGIKASESISTTKSGNENSMSNISGICKLRWTNCVNKQGVSSVMGQNNKKSEAEICCNIDEFGDFSSAIRHFGKKFPIVNPNIDRAMFPYGAKSLEQFFSWNIGKRHSSEWQRARNVKEKLMEVVKKSAKWKSEDVWTIKKIYLWLRCHGYSPIKTDETDAESEKQLRRYNMNSCSEATKLLEELSNRQKEISETKECFDEEEDDEIIDVTSVTEENKSQRVKNISSPYKSSNSVIQVTNDEGVIVKDACRQIGIELHPENACPDADAPLAEAALLCAMKLFLEDVIGLAVAEKFKKLENKKCPSYLNGFDVASAMSKFPLADFITHKGLGLKINSKSILNAKDIKL